MTRRRAALPLLVAGGSLLVAALWVVGPFIFEDRDHAESLDSAPVREAAQAACSEMQARVEAADGPEARYEAVEAMVARIRAVGPDVLRADMPAEAWLLDWERLVAAHRAGEPTPREAGAPIHRRMDDLVKDLRVCQVPDALLPPRPGR